MQKRRAKLSHEGSSPLICTRRGHGSGVPESTPAVFAFFFRIRKRSQNFVKNRTRIWSHFPISAVAEVCMVIS